MMKVQLSVVIPVYNTEKYIDRCIESVIKQYTDEMEIICIDDGSTDGSYSHIRKWSEVKNFRLFRNLENKGPAKTRNIGIKNASGDYIVFLDSDDMMKEGSLCEILELMRADNLDALYYDFTKIGEDDLPIQREKTEDSESTSDIVDGKTLFLERIRKREWNSYGCGQAVRRSLLLDNDIYFPEGILHEDVMFCYYTAICSQRVLEFKSKPYLYRIRNDGITRNTEKRIDRLYGLGYSIIQISNYILSCEDSSVIEGSFRWINGIKKLAHNEYRQLDFINREDVYKLMPVFCVIESGYDGIFRFKLSKGMMYRLRNSEYVIIYGAGYVGRALGKLLDERGVSYIFMVSSLNELGLQQEKTPIKTVEECVAIADSACVIVATMNYQAEMLKNAQVNGFSNILMLDDMCFV